MSVVDLLRRNDPTTTSIRIWLHGEPSDAELALALDQNPIITAITVSLEAAQDWNWDSLLRVIETRDNLENVSLVGGASAGRNAPAAFILAFFRAIQQNAYIRFVGLFSLRLPADISTLVEIASSIKTFVLLRCVMEPAEREQGARDLAMALQRNTSIQTSSSGQLGRSLSVFCLARPAI